MMLGESKEDLLWAGNINIMKCPKCGSSHIRVKAGMMCDLYICTNCGFETRDYYEICENGMA